MHTATAITLLFVAATSALGGARSVRIAAATSRPTQYFGAMIAFGMAVWCAYLGLWTLAH
jgi:hypothetical protein